MNVEISKDEFWPWIIVEEVDDRTSNSPYVYVVEIDDHIVEEYRRAVAAMMDARQAIIDAYNNVSSSGEIRPELT